MGVQRQFFHDSLFPSTTFEVMNELRKEQQLCDVVLRVNKKEFYIHRVVLASVSPYLRAMFTNGMAESLKKEIDIFGIDESTMELLINYSYSGSIEINSDNVQCLIAGASLLNIGCLRDACAKFLKDHMEPSNCIGIKRLASTYSIKELEAAASSYLNQNFMDVCVTDEFLQLTFENVIKLFRSDHIIVRNEEDVFCSLEHWLYYNFDERKRFSPELMKCIRIPLLSLEFLECKVFCATFVKASPKCQMFLAHVMNEKTENLPHYICTRRDLPESIYTIGGRNSSSCQLDVVERYDQCLDQWYLETSMNIARTAVAAVSLDGFIYAVGGECAINEPHDETLYLPSVECFNPMLRLWFPVTDVSIARSFVSVVVCSGKLYALGGEDRNSSYNIVERYSPKTNSWKLMPSMKKRRAGAGVTEHDGLIYIAGGYDRSVHSDRASVECYCPLKKEWSFVAELEKARSGLSLVSLKSYIYAIGGRNRSSDHYFSICEQYNPVSMQWSCVSSMLSPRAWSGVGILKNKIFVAGGFDGTNRLETVEMYNPEEDKWTLITSMNFARAGCGVAVL